MVKIERISSGIPGLDKLMEGGFVKGSTNLIAGSTGACKTIFGCQFIWHGLQNNENGVYITLEERPEDIMEDVARFGWDFKKYIDTNKFAINQIIPGNVEELKDLIINLAKRVNAGRFVLDSISLATVSWKERPEERFMLRIKTFDLIRTLKTLKLTSLLISEVPTGAVKLSRYGFEEFMVDGIIVLKILPVDIPMRAIQILKMRRTSHNIEVHPFEITNKGLVVSD
jgi:KaiC/GvpD/RAD55 family RecA-like ATPase